MEILWEDLVSANFQSQILVNCLEEVREDREALDSRESQVINKEVKACRLNLKECPLFFRDSEEVPLV